MENLSILVGYLGDAPGLKYTPQGTPVATFDIATSDQWRDGQNGEKKESLEWHRVETWGKLGEACASNLKKGSLVYVRGTSKTKSWEGEGGKKYMRYVKAEKVKFLKL